jgi:DNA-directed RNA polymerase specialized sigma24 family protein
MASQRMPMPDAPLIAALQQVPPHQRAVYLLCDEAGFALGETADMLGLTFAVAERLLGHARATLLDVLFGVPR